MENRVSGRRIAVVGSGISGLSAAWLLSKRHRVVVFEKESRLGGHANTIDVIADGRPLAVDTGFIVYNPPAYPNLTALFEHLRVPTSPSSMSFAVSKDEGTYEYAGSNILQLIGTAANAFDLGHWRMIRDIPRFFSSARRKLELLDESITLGKFLDADGYSPEFLNRHLLPMAGAIWSAAPGDMREYPARAFIRFFSNHGLLRLVNRPGWRTVAGGSRQYVNRLVEDGNFEAQCNASVTAIRRLPSHVVLTTADGTAHPFDDVVIAAHADLALAMLADASADERRLLSAFRYSQNRAVLHRDESLMPRRRWLWSSWNYHASSTAIQSGSAVTYWMNALQPLATRDNLFVSLNPPRPPHPGKVLAEFDYAHPIFDPAAMAAQRQIWTLQGLRQTWFCGAHFGSGFHEDGLQAGLAVAEQLGGVRRPWNVAAESARIHLSVEAPLVSPRLEAAE
jgi:predicted NAD/FAD-binding protein